SAQIREILISESAWEEMTCLFAPSLIYLQPTSAFGTQGMSRAREYSPGRINGQDVIVAQAIIWPEVQQNQAS
ncbi:hypothetical protein ELP32_09695, partial [Klebsiella pneumoniae]|nr:hypothetical protein [Klebsiella pneumoniae]